MCFYCEPEKIIGGCYVKIGKFEGSEILYQDEFHGSLILIADRVIDFIYLKYLKAAISYHKETRVETYPFAREAVREAVYNALIHSDWSDNNPVQIRIEDEVMYISNSSLLPPDFTAETMMHSHRSMPLNPEIADVFYRAGYIERWGRGIQKICDACREHGADEPVYTVQSNYVMVRFAALASAIVRDSKVPNRHDGGLNDGLEVGIENKVLRIIGSNPNVTMAEISAQLSVTKRTVERTVKRLRENNRIERVGGKRYGHWEIHE